MIFEIQPIRQSVGGSGLSPFPAHSSNRIQPKLRVHRTRRLLDLRFRHYPRPRTPPLAPKPTEFTPAPANFTAELAKFTPEPAKFTPELTKFTPELTKFTPEPAKFTPEPAKFTPELTKFTPELTKFTPELTKFTPELAVPHPAHRILKLAITHRKPRPLKISPSLKIS